jgi:hypothetical protein
MRNQRTRSFVPGTPGGHELEPRIALSTAQAAIHASAVHAASRPPIDTSIPFVFATTGGAPQFALNFTSHTYDQILFGGPNTKGLQQILNSYNKTGNINQVAADLSRLSYHVPYGQTDLLSIWQTSLTNYANGLGTADATNGGPFHGRNAIVANQLRIDLINYLNTGVGASYNVQLSHEHEPRDGDLVYNSKVGQTPPRPIMTI